MILALALLACTGEPPDEPTPPAVDPAEALFDAVSEDALWSHLEALQAQADENVALPGVRDRAATRAWARALLEDAGYTVEEQPFQPDGWSHTQCPDPVCAGTNLLVTWPDEPAGPALLVGGHLDLVDGPGLNDNGTGVATVMELALQAAALGLVDDAPLRFALWDGEETGGMGSWAYLLGAELVPLTRDPGPIVDELLGYLNVDMIGSVNGVAAQFDVDGAHTTGDKGPRGSATIEAALSEGFAQQGIEAVLWPLGATHLGMSDHDSFVEARVPAGGLWTGGRELKTADEAAAFGGTADEPYDSCYHSACDDLDNVDAALLTEMARAAAWATGALAGRGSLVEE